MTARRRGTSTAVDVLDTAVRRGLRLRAEGGRLRVEGPVELRLSCRPELLEHRDAIVAVLEVAMAARASGPRCRECGGRLTCGQPGAHLVCVRYSTPHAVRLAHDSADGHDEHAPSGLSASVAYGPACGRCGTRTERSLLSTTWWCFTCRPVGRGVPKVMQTLDPAHLQVVADTTKRWRQDCRPSVGRWL